MTVYQKGAHPGMRGGGTIGSEWKVQWPC